MQINNIDIPDSMMVVGTYTYNWQPPKIVGYNGQKEPITAGNASLTITFSLLNDDEWEWWTQTLLNGEKSAEFTQCQLVDDDRALTTFGHCRVYRPVRGDWDWGRHTDAVVHIVDIY
jgi:hypothetical protein